ncbi:MAG: UDP-N-acetylglucosamine 3-dehydrogenase [Saprospiraceae bacterium]|jgi:UDP-N-acetylglucosamine 3-dehydrogenase
MNYKLIPKGQPIRICFLGCGNITQRHAKLISKSGQQVALSFASRSIEKAEDYKKKFSGAFAYASYEEAIKSDDQDVIMINTPPHIHFELAEFAVGHDKHLIVEKPPFFKSADFDVIGKIADKKGLHFMVAENYYYKPLRKKVQETLESGLIGDPLFLHINATKIQESKKDWREDPEITGFGALFEGGIHWINFINNLGFDIKEIRGYVPGPKTVLERSIQVIANTEQGVVMNLLYSWEVNTIFKGLRRSKVYGRDGSLTFETNGIFAFLRGKKTKLMFPGLSNISGAAPMIDDFLGVIREGRDPQFTWKMAQRDLELIEEIYASMEDK